MPEELNRSERCRALVQHPLSGRSMNQGHGAMAPEMARSCDISIPDGWVGILEELYAEFEALGEYNWPRISQIKEKFASLCVYVNRPENPDPEIQIQIREAITRAEGRASRTCQVCGCRGRRRVLGGWHATLCTAHYQANQQRRDKYVDPDSIPGADDPLPGFAMNIEQTRHSGLQVNYSDLYVASRGGYSSHMREYLSSRIEPECLVVALDPAGVVELLGGEGLPFRILDAREAFADLARQHGRDQAELDLRLGKAIKARDDREARAALGVNDRGHPRHPDTRQCPNELRELGRTWRWLVGLEDVRNDDDE